ncbi:hypothetical protein VCRA2121O157_90103 [Vibrio crassostreae]|nr:hypothetical protein VCRA2113O138_100093 [Vibrio crassostreae]CAK1718572.1 hypothetical protein VCRA2113O140_110093 [Vibrio crassostreae]CAK2228140.1 hypothetical protein VCRA2116O141_110073 [Vibrio crassostreae]CAK2590589.1 hypothetical protein VCRA2113O139_110095 [Vibrio crassostreae]CAK2816496.1 hypothetical protein VCRA2119O149_20064 [Vibrio crassostreae]
MSAVNRAFMPFVRHQYIQGCLSATPLSNLQYPHNSYNFNPFTFAILFMSLPKVSAELIFISLLFSYISINQHMPPGYSYTR